MASRYEDQRLDGDVLLYDYAPENSAAWANDGLKRLAQQGRPVIWLDQVKGKPNPEYMVFAPVAILGFDDAARKFRLGLAEAQVDAPGLAAAPTPGAFVEAYATTMVQARLHQARFRKATLMAYSDQCAICELRERPLFDAAHIVPDRLPESVPKVQNGLAMCPTHHRAYDQDFLTITEQYRVVVQRERLRQPHSAATARTLFDFDQRTIVLPRDRGGGHVGARCTAHVSLLLLACGPWCDISTVSKRLEKFVGIEEIVLTTAYVVDTYPCRFLGLQQSTAYSVQLRVRYVVGESRLEFGTAALRRARGCPSSHLASSQWRAAQAVF